jgi:hypothetical protein
MQNRDTNMNDFDLWPESPQPRAILAALAVLRHTGIAATLEVKPDADHRYSIVFNTAATAEGRETQRQSMLAVFEYQRQSAVADLAVTQLKQGKRVELP